MALSYHISPSSHFHFLYIIFDFLLVVITCQNAARLLHFLRRFSRRRRHGRLTARRAIKAGQALAHDAHHSRWRTGSILIADCHFLARRLSSRASAFHADLPSMTGFRPRSLPRAVISVRGRRPPTARAAPDDMP